MGNTSEVLLPSPAFFRPPLGYYKIQYHLGSYKRMSICKNSIPVNTEFRYYDKCGKYAYFQGPDES